MCIVFFRKFAPSSSGAHNLAFVLLFNRDESLARERSPLCQDFFEGHSIACGVDLQAHGTWLGVNLKTGNIGFLTNYESKPFQAISDPRYRKGNLLMNFLKQTAPLREVKEYCEYLGHFMAEGQKFNGTNIWLGNLSLGQTMPMVFTNN